MNKITYTKNGAEKQVEEGSGLIPIIEADGWKKKTVKKPSKKKAE